ncbi:hypothetical protein [Mesorhizobium sp. M0578]|uniref:hypothetical protein n=1 Tax=unclassified Mesorhizobium TaxID=325217 RepID=UPI0033381406
MNQRIDKMVSRAFARQVNEFWSRPEAWPRDMPKHVFFARVIHEMGKSRFPTEWPDDIRQIRRDAHFGTIALAIADHCATGRLVGAVQDSLGRPLELPEYVWNTREFEEWFAIGQAPLSHAYPQGDWHPLAARPQCWLFIGRDGLRALTGTPVTVASSESMYPAGKPANSPRVQESPQQRRVLDVVAKLYPDGAPGRDSFSDTQIVALIQGEFEEMKKHHPAHTRNKITNPSRDTILRALGRKPSA